MIDLIGDIHGHATELKNLLEKLGYALKDGTYTHPERKVVFVGDFIDRGPNIPETLRIVKSMVDSENAIAIMGNHEYNALCFHFKDPNGGHLRKHSIDNLVQHYETILQFKKDHKQYEAYLEWFKTLPLYYETEGFKAVHACWDASNIAFLRNTLVNDRLTDDLIYQSVKKGTELYWAIDQTLKGKEMKLPAGVSFADKDEKIRTETRIKWWENPAHMTYHSISVKPIDGLPHDPVDISKIGSSAHYPEDDKHVFFGHYWLTGDPAPNKANVCCLDYSVANEGKLVAYRLNGESTLTKENMVHVQWAKK